MRPVTGNGGPYLAIMRLAYKSFQLPLTFYFHLSFTDGKEVAFLYLLVTLLQLLILAIQFLFLPFNFQDNCGLKKP
jgi:hypothetical protein